MVLGGNDSAGLGGALYHQLLIQRLPGEHVHHTDGDALGLKLLIGLQRLVHHDAGGDDSSFILVALAEDDALAQCELCAVAIDLDDVLPDEAGVGDALAVRHLLGDGLQLGIVAGIGDHRLGDGQVHGGVLQRHMGAAVEGGAHACVGTEHMDRQIGIGGGHVDLVIDAAAGEGAEGVEIHLLASGGKTCAHTGGVGLGDARLIGPVGVGGHQLLGVDAAHQVAVHVAHGLVRGHHVL